MAVGFDGPAFLQRLVAQESLYCVDPDRLVDIRTVAGLLAGVIAHASMRGGQGLSRTMISKACR